MDAAIPSFGSMSFASNNLNFTVTQASGANGLHGMLPWRSGSRFLNNVTRNGSAVTFEVMTVKGIEYAVFAAPQRQLRRQLPGRHRPPTIASRTPGAGATGVSPATTIRAVFSESMDQTTINSTTFEVRDATNALVPGTVSYSSGSLSATFTPASALVSGTTYTATLRGGASDPRVKDLAGNALAANASWSFTTAIAPTCPCFIFGVSDTPAVASDSDIGSVELGVKFRSDINGFIKGIRFFKGPTNIGTHVGTLWSATGTPLAQATFQNETSGGWQQVLFTTPVAVTAGTTYVASYHAPMAVTRPPPASSRSRASTTACCTRSARLPETATVCSRMRPASSFPNSSWNGTNYWVDVVFDTNGTAPPDTTAPVVTINSPVSTPTFDAGATPLSIGGTASDNVAVTQVSWANDRGGSGIATGTTSWLVSNITLLSGVNVITVTARDAANNTSTDTLTVTYTPGSDTTPPTVSSRTPSAAATNVALATTVSVGFSEVMDLSTIGTSTIELRNASNVLVPSTVSYDAATRVATLTPNAALALNTQYTVTVRGGATDPRVKDAAGNALAANDTWSFTTTAVLGDHAQPLAEHRHARNALRLGNCRGRARGEVPLRREPATSPACASTRDPTNTGTHVGHLWSITGTLLGEVTFARETATGWQQATVRNPIAIDANTTYVVSYFAPNGGYSINGSYFASSGVDNGVLHAPSDRPAAATASTRYGPTGGFPNNSFGATNYWVDVVFQNVTGPDTTPPTVTTRSPASGAVNVAIGGNVTVSFSESMDATTINGNTIQLRNAGNTLIPATVTFAGNAGHADAERGAGATPASTR